MDEDGDRNGEDDKDDNDVWTRKRQRARPRFRIVRN